MALKIYGAKIDIYIPFATRLRSSGFVFIAPLLISSKINPLSLNTSIVKSVKRDSVLMAFGGIFALAN